LGASDAVPKAIAKVGKPGISTDYSRGDHQHSLDPNLFPQPLDVQKNDVYVGSRQCLDLKEGANVTLDIQEDAINERVKVTISAAGGGSSHEILSATHTDALIATVLRGALIVGNSTPKWALLALGTTGKVLRSNGTDALWAALACADLSDHTKAVHDALAINADLLDGNEATAFAVAAKGVTNGDTHDHLGGDGAQINHTSLASIGTNTHTQLDTHLGAAAPHSGHELTANKGVASGYCDLDGSVLVPLARIPATLTGKDADTLDTYHHGSFEKVANKDQASGYAGLSAGSKLAASQMPTGKVKTTLSLAVTGTLTVGTDQAPILLAPCTLTVTSVRLVVRTAPTGADLQVDVNKNGTSIFNAHGDLKIVAGATTGNAVPVTTALALDDKLTVDIVQIGSTIAGAGLTVEVVADQAVTFS
jgi:hypothetical protein